MKPTRRHIRLTFVKTGESAVAELLEDEAPTVCQKVWESLPQENTHAPRAVLGRRGVHPH